ncbi:hypothetical protein ACFTTN_35765 [Streptomyces niveus]|uniref:hypothetical protein n=1 Tax=Streptomyces niveus TaxID=193462 RepID=UPI00364391F8
MIKHGFQDAPKAEAKKGGWVVDLMSALEESVQQAKKSRGETGEDATVHDMPTRSGGWVGLESSEVLSARARDVTACLNGAVVAVCVRRRREVACRRPVANVLAGLADEAAEDGRARYLFRPEAHARGKNTGRQLPPWPERSTGPRPVPDRLCLQGIL